MIRLWLSRETSVPLREQLTAQLLLGILSRKLQPGERLPSVRALARRLRIHSNTVSAAYQDLAARGWVTGVRGSGVFVCRQPAARNETDLDSFVRGLIREGTALGFTPGDLEQKIGQIARELRSRTLLVVDPDPELARILAAEIGEGLGAALPFTGLAELATMTTSATCILVNQAVSPAELEVARGQLGANSHRLIGLRSMEDFVAGQIRPSPATLIAVLSRSAAVLRWASKLLGALGFEPSRLVLRNPADPDWREGLAFCDIVASDMVTARELPAHFPAVVPLVFRLVSAEFIESMRRFVTGEEV